jgi:hypothetical protein
MKTIKCWCLVALALLLTFSPQMVVGLPASREEEFAEYGIKFYDPDDSETAGGMFCGGFGTSGGALVGNNTVQQMANFFLSQGFTPAQAAGIIGNAQQESSLWPLALSGSGTYWGIFQWGGGRRDVLDQKLIAAGHSEYVNNRETYRNANSAASRAIPQDVIDDILRIQLEHAMTETRDYWDFGPWVEAVKATNTAEEATEAFLFIFLGAVSPTGRNHPDDLIRFWVPRATGNVYYQETRQRREFALEIAGQASGTCGLVAGGMTLEQAQAWLDATGYLDLSNDIHSRFNLPGHNQATWCSRPGPHGSRRNCVGFSTYFVRAYTSIADAHATLGQSPGNGNLFVNRLLSVAPHVAYGNQPQPYAVFSNGMSREHGHTGVILGVDEARQTMVVAEAGCAVGGAGYDARVREYSFDGLGSDVIYAYLMPFVNIGGF